MDTLMASYILKKLPLAKATMQVWRWIFDPQSLADCFERHRGRCYERVITFEMMIHLMADALINYQGNARRCFEEAIADGTLSASVQAAYGKLRHVPIGISESLINRTSLRLRAIWPEGITCACPDSLSEFDLSAIDGKTIKGVKRRLKPLRGVKGGLMGGRSLVSLSLRYGTVEAMKSDPDGHAAEVNMVPDLVTELRSTSQFSKRLWVCDRGFCKQNTIELLGDGDDAYLVRYTKKLLYTRDNMMSERDGVDDEGRYYEESWGWIGTVKEPKRFRVRRLKLHLEDIDNGESKEKSESLILITNLDDGECYPAVDLLNLYRRRWHIERVFQEVTEVFGLKHLIGSSPEATIFQFSFCLILYNVIQVHRAFLAQNEEREVSTISTEKYFQDVRDDLIACMRLIDPGELPSLIVDIDNAVDMRESLRTLLAGLWKPRWVKSPPNRRRRAKVRTGPQSGERYGRCVSVHRILQEAKYRAQTE